MRVHWWTSWSQSRPQGGARPMEVQMTKQSPHKRWKGCCLMCASNGGKIRGAKTVDKVPFRELRKIGVKRRYNRNKAYGDEA